MGHFYHILSCLSAFSHLVSYQCLYLSLKCWCSSGINARPSSFLWSFRPLSVCLLDHPWMFHLYFKFSISVSTHPTVLLDCYLKWMLMSCCQRQKRVLLWTPSYFFFTLRFLSHQSTGLVSPSPKYLRSIPFPRAPSIMQVYLLPRLFILTIFLFLGFFPLYLFFLIL